MNLYQIKQLKELLILPQLVVALELSDEKVTEKLQHVRYDSKTGVKYETQAAAEAADPAVKKRLVQKPEDSTQMIEKRLNDYRDFLAAAETEYNQQLIRINCEETSDKIHVSFCDAIENSL